MLRFEGVYAKFLVFFFCNNVILFLSDNCAGFRFKSNQLEYPSVNLIDLWRTRNRSCFTALPLSEQASKSINRKIVCYGCSLAHNPIVRVLITAIVKNDLFSSASITDKKRSCSHGQD